MNKTITIFLILILISINVFSYDENIEMKQKARKLKVELDAYKTLQKIKNQATTEISQAIINEDENKLKKLIDEGYDINEKAGNNMTPLMFAAFVGNLKITNVLLEYGADINAISTSGYTPLMYLFSFWVESEEKILERLTIERKLLRLGADVNIMPHSSYNSILMLAILTNETKLVQALFEKDVKNINYFYISDEKKERVYNALLYAVKYSNFEIIKLLLENGADIQLVEKAGYSPLTHMYSQDDPLISIKAVKLLLEYGADVNILNYSKEHTPLSLASVHNDLEVVKLLLEAGADPNFKSKRVFFPLTNAAVMGNIEVMKVLIQSGANIDNRLSEEFWKRTALMMAAEFNQVEAVRVLLEAGADGTLRDSKRSTTMKIAKKKGYDEIVEILKEYGYKK